jgi:chloride channel 3/4/5
LSEKICCLHQHPCTDWYSWNSGLLGPLSGFIIYTFITLLFATASAKLVRAYAPNAAGSGIPEIKTILGGFIIKDFLSATTLVIKTLGVVLAVGSGLAVGKEGPLVHIACALTKSVAHVTKKYRYNAANTRELLSAACAGGVSVAFGAPIGGVLFSLEEVSFYFPHKTMFRSFFLAMVSALSLQFINPFRTGKLVLFQVDVEQDWKSFELVGFMILGVLGGIYGSFFIKMVFIPN